MSTSKTYNSVDEYIDSHPAPIQSRLQELRSLIRTAAPSATEKISYGIPTFAMGASIVYFAAYKSHIGLYPAPRASSEFAEELKQYKGGTGTVQFPHSKPLPTDLIKRIVKFRIRSIKNEA